MGRAQRRVSLRHHRRLVPKDLLDRVEVPAAHNHATRRRVPEVVEPEIVDLGVLHRLCPRPAEVVEELPSRRSEPGGAHPVSRGRMRRRQYKGSLVVTRSRGHA
jgi:hypothetical protein